MKKTELIQIRVTRKQKNLIKGKARLHKKTISQWILGELIGAHAKKITN